MYMALKHSHMLLVALSGLLFLLRGIWMLLDSPRLQQRWVKIVPHVIDTLLLATAIGLMFQIQQYPIAQSWLTAKVVALVVYIVLGTIAIKRGKTKAIRSLALVLALLCFAYLVSVAFSHHPAGFFA